MKSVLSRFLVLAVSLFLVAPASPIARAAEPSAMTGTLAPGGGWAAFSFVYAGDRTDVTIRLSYTPADPFTDQAVELRVFEPDAPPPDSLPLGRGGLGKAPGEKLFAFTSDKGGAYTAFIQNWDFLNRTVEFNLTVVNTATGAAGPALTLLSSSAATVASPAPSEPGAAPAPSAPSQPTAAPAPPPPASGTKISGELPSGGGWASFSFVNPGDRTDVTIRISYTPADPIADQTVELRIYAPDLGPPDHEPFGRGGAGPVPGQKVFAFATDNPNPFTIFIQNWDERTVAFTLETLNTFTGEPGPVLTVLGSGR